RKLTDVAIDNEYVLKNGEIIVCEVAYRNEYFDELIYEGALLLSVGSDILYCLLICMIESEDKSRLDAVRIILMKRALPSASEKQGAWPSKYKSCLAAP